MTAPTAQELTRKRCVPCEGGIPPVGPEAAAAMLADLPGWSMTADGRRIRKTMVARNFVAAIDFFNKVAELSEAEGHHPDLHLEGYRNVAVELWTHAIGGLSENDFILAAKIDEIPVKARKSEGPGPANIPHV